MTNERAEKVAAALLALISLAALTTAVVLYVPYAVFGSGWKKAGGTVVRSNILREHDSRARLVFRLEAVFQYEANGQPHVGTGTTAYSSTRFANAVHLYEQYAAQTKHPIYYEAADPQKIRFETGATWRNVKYSVLWALAGLLFAIASFVVFRRSGHSPECANCGEWIKGYYQFCPMCATAVAER